MLCVVAWRVRAVVALLAGDGSCEGVVQIGDGGFARNHSVAQLPLLARNFLPQRCDLILRLAQAANVGAIGRTDEMRQHMSARASH